MKNVPGFVKVVSKGNYVAVVCEREEQAIQAARQLKAELEQAGDGGVPVVRGSLHGYMRSATPTSSTPPSVRGNAEAAMMEAAKVVEADYEIPFRDTRPIGPAHAMADPSNDQMTIYSNDMKSCGHARGRRRRSCKIPRDRVRVVWMEGPQGYGRTAADDAGFEAAYLAKELGRPVRRAMDDGTRRRPGTPRRRRSRVKVRGGLDAQGNLIAFDYDARAADFNHLGYNEPDTVLIAQLMGIRRALAGIEAAPRPQARCTPIPNRRMTMHVVSLPLGVGDAAADGQPARPEWAAVHVRVRVVHRRARRGRRMRIPWSSG